MKPEVRFFQRTFLRKAFSNFRAEMQTAQGTAADKGEGKAASDGLGLHLVAVDSVWLALAVDTQPVRRFAPCGVALFGITRVELQPEVHGFCGHPFDAVGLHLWRKISCDVIPCGCLVFDAGRDTHAVAAVEVQTAPQAEAPGHPGAVVEALAVECRIQRNGDAAQCLGRFVDADQRAVQVGGRSENAAHAQGQALLKIAPVVVTHVQQLIVDHPGIGRDAAVLRCEPVAVVEECGVDDVDRRRPADLTK